MHEPLIALFPPIEHGRTADEVVRQVELLILEGVLRDGDRLPGERDLAERLGVSRPILREALKELENRGLLVSRHGGGTFVADIIGQVFSAPLAALIARHERATADYLEYRRELEGLTAELAAARATPADRALLARIVDDMRAAHEAGHFDDEMEADLELHNAIGEAAHNIVLLHTLRACYRLLSEGIFYHRRLIFDLPGARDRLLAQHVALAEAIMAGDPARARRAAEEHIDYVTETNREAARQDDRNRIATLRLQQRQARPANTPRRTASSSRNDP
ncbi:FadR/GntR family transcriptional regulator [Gellertiella hungarica]|uniref:Pyruvate dehydrogenase complex repressor n=1 Tax=Gellertiella hungarica TaxID=1572859 RepID=A0A7W6J3U5_9HYPH|nr:FadR/GntR family transcriptional regulator [Gellertiella hungarica]MBB4064275.1 GntR family transcriptional repressor for pyruvate dehydrogenase complex [Gellertiella hungarica]